MPRRIPDQTLLPHVHGGQQRTAVQIAITQVVNHWTESPEHTEQTRTRMSETVLRFARRLAATGVTELDGVTTVDARAFVLAPTRHGPPPEIATQHARRTAVRTLFRTARLLGLSDSDPTLDLVLPARGQRAARPLSDDEITLCRASAQIGRPGSTLTRATAWALGEATAVSSEITAVRICDLDDPHQPTVVRLPGTRRHDPRDATLTAWGALVLQRRARGLLDTGATPQTLLAYGGHAPPGGAKAQAAVCNALREVLNSAGLLAEADVRPASVRNWAGRTAYDTGQPLDRVARLLGLRSLDAAAEDIALTWR